MAKNKEVKEKEEVVTATSPSVKGKSKKNETDVSKLGIKEENITKLIEENKRLKTLIEIDKERNKTIKAMNYEKAQNLLKLHCKGCHGKTFGCKGCTKEQEINNILFDKF